MPVRFVPVLGIRAVICISLRAPAWGATTLNFQRRHATIFQSTHPHGVRLRMRYQRLLQHYFNPRTRMGCDGLKRRSPPPKFDFNPRTRMGCDHSHDDGGCGSYPISIHAPAWGATTGRSAPEIRNSAISIHAPAWGATLILTDGYHTIREFQSTHPRGVRRFFGITD